MFVESRNLIGIFVPKPADNIKEVNIIQDETTYPRRLKWNLEIFSLERKWFENSYFLIYGDVINGNQ